MQDAENIANGVYAPLGGFLRAKDFQSVLDSMRLENGKAWSIPIVLDINGEDYRRLKNENSVVLKSPQPSFTKGGSNENPPTPFVKGAFNVALENIEIYKYDKKEFARKVFGTEDANHPGVRDVMEMGEYLVGGDVKNQNLKIKNQNDNLKCKISPLSLNSYFYTPGETKDIFRERGWKTAVAFQTRNVPHRSHEFLQKKALEGVDGLLIHPVVGKKKPGDFKDEVILSAYKILMDKYYPKDKSLLGVLPIRMRYAGPREAVMHALIRGNYGCTHIIIGRDHAGVGSYYGSYDAHNIFNEFSSDELGIEILKFENVSHCRPCGELKMEKACAHEPEHKFHLSGTKIRDMINNKESLPKELIRPEISKFLINHPSPFME